MAAAEAKSAALAGLFAPLVAVIGGGTTVETPVPRHGAQVIVRHPQARRIMARLIARGVIGDCRPPDLIRFGFPALYTRFANVAPAVAAVLDSGEWQDIRLNALGVVS